MTVACGKLAATLLAAASAAAAAEAVRYEIRESEVSRLELTVVKTGLLAGKKHLFVFERYRGTVFFDAKSPEASQVSFCIAAHSAVCRDTWVSAKDLRKIQEFALKDMLAADQHPDITFSSVSIRQIGSGRYEVLGNLAIRGRSRPARVEVALEVQEGGGTLAITGSSVIRMKDYGLKPPSAALGTIGTKDEMSFTFRLTGRRATGMGA